MTSEQKPIVILIPGMGNNERLWQHQVDALAGISTVIVSDITGCGSIAEMAEKVLQQAPGEPLSVVGFSLGGYVAFEIMRIQPARVCRLAFISSSAFADNEVAIVQRKRLIEKAGDDYHGLLQDMSNFIVFADGPNASATRSCVVEMGEELGSDEFCRQQTVAMRRKDCRGILAGIRVPTQILCGRNDMITPVDGNAYLADNISGASLTVLDNAGHLLPLERPQEVNRFLIDWLNASAKHS